MVKAEKFSKLPCRGEIPDELRDRFCDAYSDPYTSLRMAQDAVGINNTTYRWWRLRHPEFCAHVDEVKRIKIEDLASRMAALATKFMDEAENPNAAVDSLVKRTQAAMNASAIAWRGMDGLRAGLPKDAAQESAGPTTILAEGVSHSEIVGG